jgi:hypothetical protein
MSTEFGWWVTDPEQGKYQVKAVVHGGRLKWFRKQGHFTSWEVLVPTDENWDRLISEAERRVPRRLLSPKQFIEIRNLREHR